MKDPHANETVIHSDRDLIGRWFLNQKLVERGGTPLWNKVSETFAIGSTSAKQVCRRHDEDPDAIVRVR
jgi:hypothetical protein